MGFDRVPRQAEPGNVVPLGQQRRDGLVVGVALSPQLLIDPNKENASFLDPRQDLRMSRLDRAAFFMEARQSRKAAEEAAAKDKAAEEAAAKKDAKQDTSGSTSSSSDSSGSSSSET